MISKETHQNLMTWAHSLILFLEDIKPQKSSTMNPIQTVFALLQPEMLKMLPSLEETGLELLKQALLTVISHVETVQSQKAGAPPATLKS